MALQKKYFFNFRGLSNRAQVVEIWQDTTSVITATEIRGDALPFTIDWPAVNLKTSPVRGSGCTINLLSETNMQFLGLFSSKINEFQVRHYIDGVLHWMGWLDTEIYSEPFDSISNYPVSISGTDGFALLDRLHWVDGLENKFTGPWAEWDVLRMILYKINLPYRFLYTQISTTIEGVTITGSETILHKTYFHAGNFYNEDGEPETLRKVLESILNKYGLIITLNNGSLFIVDIEAHLEAGSNWILQKWSIPDLAYIAHEYGFGKFSDVADLGFAGASQTLSVVPAFNMQVVSFSPYIREEFLDFVAGTDDFTDPQAPGSAIGSPGYQWTETKWLTSYSWYNFDLSGFYNLDAVAKVYKEFYLATKRTFTPAQNQIKQFANKIPFPYVIPAGYQLKIEMQGYFRFTDDLDNPAYTPSVLRNGVLWVQIKIGDYKYSNDFTDQWVPVSETARKMSFEFGNIAGTDPVEDQWLDAGHYQDDGTGLNFERMDYLIPLSAGFTGGHLEFEILGYDCYNLSGALIYTAKDARWNNIKFTILDADGNDLKLDDIEYAGLLNPTYKSEGPKAELLLGTNVDDQVGCRGGLMTGSPGVATQQTVGTTLAYMYYPNSTDLSLFHVGDLVSGNPNVLAGSRISSVGQFFSDIILYLTVAPIAISENILTTFTAPPGNLHWIKHWNRAGKVDTIENLLLATLMSNYETKALRIVLTTNLNENIVSALTYENYLPGIRFMIMGMKNDYDLETSEITMEQIFENTILIQHSTLWQH